MSGVVDLEESTMESSSIGDSSDEDLSGIDSSDLKDKLLDILVDVKGESVESFAMSGLLPNASNLVLSVNGLETIDLPLSTRDAIELRNQWH